MSSKDSSGQTLIARMSDQLYVEFMAKYCDHSLSDSEFIGLCDRLKRLSELSACFYYKDHDR
jgi:hypothetical protein